MKRLTALLLGLLAGCVVLAIAWYLREHKSSLGDLAISTFESSSVQQAVSSVNQTVQLVRPTNFEPQVPDGFQVGAFASGIKTPRDLAVSPAGTLVVSTSNNGQVLAFPDANKDLQSDKTVTVLSGLNRPNGLVFHDKYLYVAEETKVTRYEWDETNLKVNNPQKILDLPKGGLHFSRSLAFVGNQLFVSIGSTCNVCKESNEWLASVITSDADGKNAREYSSGLRNAVFLAVRPNTNQVWSGVMGRDNLGDTLPPDTVVNLQDGKNYGWPYCYGDKVTDSKSGLSGGIDCNTMQVANYQLPAHVAPLGLTFVNSDKFPSDYQGDLLLAEHGSWNSSVPVGYKVVRLHMDGDSVTSSEDFMTGFIDGKDVKARPVDVEFGKNGELYVSDDKAGMVYVVEGK